MPRRYFHPLISQFQYYRSNASADPARYPVAQRVGEQVLCLPIYPDLGPGDVHRVVHALRAALVA